MIVIQEKCDYGQIMIDLKPVMEKKHITAYRLSKMTGIKRDTIHRYRYDKLYRVDLFNLAKICWALDCDSDDIIRYVKH